MVVKTIKEKFTNKAPYEIGMEVGLNSHKTRPFYVKTTIDYNDSNFKKRMRNVMREETYILEYEFIRKNAGSLFKPNYINTIEINLTKRLLNKSDSAMLTIATFGLFDSKFERDGVIEVNSLLRGKLYFKEAEEAKLFAKESQVIMSELMSKYYDEYKEIDSYKFEE